MSTRSASSGAGLTGTRLTNVEVQLAIVEQGLQELRDKVLALFDQVLGLVTVVRCLEALMVSSYFQITLNIC